MQLVRPIVMTVVTYRDAEEYGLIGSIEFIETYFKTLSAQTIAYLNVDIAVMSRLVMTIVRLQEVISFQRMDLLP